MKAVLVGAYEEQESFVLTQFGESIDATSQGRLKQLIERSGPPKHSKMRVFYDFSEQFPIVAVVGLGSKDAGFNAQEDLDEAKENVRKAIGTAISSLQKLDIKLESVQVDATIEPQAAAEGATIGGYTFCELKAEKSREKQVPLELGLTNACTKSQASWQRGVVLGKYQNMCKRLMELPANHLTPTKFAEEAKKLAEPFGVKVIVHDREWAEQMKMGSFLSVSNGSVEPPKFVELHYKNSSDEQRKPIVFVGKGVTFDSGGISLKPSAKMDEMRADMGGAANVLCTIAALAELKADVNIIGLIPLTENLPSGSATKPGDVVFAMNGKSIQINNTDAEGRLILADALCYADTFEPELVVDIATLTGACMIAIGEAASAAFSTSENYWELLHKAGQMTGDRFWRLPLFAAHSRQTKDGHLADMVNISKNPSFGGGSCVAAAFLKEFTTAKNWLHLDIASSMSNTGDISYIAKGMSGRPLRTLVTFFETLQKP